MVAGTPQFDAARSPAASRHIVETAIEHGLDPAVCLTGSGLSLPDLTDPTTEVYADQELTIVRNVISRLGNRTGLGMETGSRYTLADTGILGYALMASPTFGDAIEVGCRYLALTAIYVSVAAPEITDAEAVIAVDDSGIPTDVRQFLIERDFAMALRLLPSLLGTLDRPMTFRLELADVRLPTGLVEMENLTITLERSARTALTFPAHLMKRPMPVADPQTAAICIRQCEELLNRRRFRRGVSAVVRSRMIQESNRIPSMATVAKELCVTERTLHHRLAAEGTSYRALLNEIRATLAAEMLDSGFTVEETAHRLGYSETSVLTRAHTRWSGHPPSRRNR